jgi:hypothetical protein
MEGWVDNEIIQQVGCNNQRALRQLRMTYNHNLLVEAALSANTVCGFDTSCRNALGLIATYADYFSHNEGNDGS